MYFTFHSKLLKLLFTFSFLIFLKSLHAQTAINADYNKNSFKDKTISMFYLESARVTVFNIDNAKDMFSTFKGEDKYIYSHNLYDAFLRNMKLNLKGIKYINHNSNNKEDINYSDRSKFVNKNIEVGEDKTMISFNIPKRETVTELEFKSDLLCIINNVVISNTEPTDSDSYNDNGILVQIEDGLGILNSKIKYIIWDYSEDKPVSYGKLDVNSSYSVDVSRNVMLDHFNKVINKIYKSSPIKYKRSF